MIEPLMLVLSLAIVTFVNHSVPTVASVRGPLLLCWRSLPSRKSLKDSFNRRSVASSNKFSPYRPRRYSFGSTLIDLAATRAGRLLGAEQIRVGARLIAIESRTEVTEPR